MATVGTFDGLHLGHWSVIGAVADRAEATGARSVLVTFEPHPLTVVRPEAAPKRLTTAVERMELLEGSRLDDVVVLAFTPELRAHSPRRFVTELLLGRLGVDELVVGHDHGFGHGRAGDTDTLARLGAELGFSVTVRGPVRAGTVSCHPPASDGRSRAATSPTPIAPWGAPTRSPGRWCEATAAAARWAFQQRTS